MSSPARRPGREAGPPTAEQPPARHSSLVSPPEPSPMRRGSRQATKPSSQPPRRRRKEARPGEILAAALQVFAERGFAAAKIDEVAARAGVGKGTVYLYFDSKEALFKAVVTATLGPELDRAAARLAHYDGSCAQLLEQLLSQVVRLAARKEIGAIPKLVIAEAGNFPDLAKFYLETVIRRAMAVMRQVIQRGVDGGEFRPVDVKQAVRVLIAPLLFAVLWRHTFEPHDDEPFDVDAFSRTHIDLALAALRPQAEAAP